MHSRMVVENLTRICERLNEAAVHEFSVIHGNWFKVFNHFDTDESKSGVEAFRDGPSARAPDTQGLSLGIGPGWAISLFSLTELAHAPPVRGGRCSKSGARRPRGRAPPVERQRRGLRREAPSTARRCGAR